MKTTRAEWRWAARVSGGVMLLTLLPYVVGFAHETAAWEFTGFLFGAEDGNSYIASMLQGTQGAWLFRLPYSSEPQRGALVYSYYLLLGKLAAAPGLHVQLVVLFHLARLLSGFALLLVTYRFLAEYLPEVRQRRLGLLLVALGGGLGWLLVITGNGQWLGSLPLDLYSPETFTFLTLYGLPHLAAARALLLAGMLLYLRQVAQNAPSSSPSPSVDFRARGQGGAGLLFLLLGFIQPLYVLVGYAVIGAHVAALWLLRQREAARTAFRAAFVIGLISSPLVIYTALAFTLDPVLKQWGAQNVVRSPHPLHYLPAYGLLLIPAIAGLRALHRRDPLRAAFLGGWAVLLPLLVYAPYNLNRRFAEGFHVALVTMAVAGLLNRPTGPPERSAFNGATRLRRVSALLIPALTLPTSFILLLGGLTAASTPSEPLFLPAGEVAMFRWLASHAAPRTVVLAAYDTGNVLPAYAPLVSYVGHGPETVFLSEKLPRVRRFFRAATSDDQRLSLLAENDIGYLIYGPHEAALGDFDPEAAPYLRAAASHGEYAVYEVLR